MIRLWNVSKLFDPAPARTVAALKCIDLTINGDGALVICGPSGSGKTTLLSLIGCMTRPTSGRILINNVEVSTLVEGYLAEVRRRYFGFMFQDFQLIRGFSVLTNVMLPLYPGRESLRKIRARALSLLSEVDMASRARAQVEHLSTGEQQRVALARALINDPDFLLADEPTAHLDSKLANRFLSMVEALKKRGKTVLITSHDPLVCRSRVIDRVVTLRDGCLQPDEVPA